MLTLAVGSLTRGGGGGYGGGKKKGGGVEMAMIKHHKEKRYELY